MRVISYSRVSTIEQSDHGVSLDNQESKNTAYAALYDLEIVAVIRDAGESAKTLNRPGLQRALAMLRDGSADGLLITKIDRLTRSVSDWEELISGYFCEKKGKELLSVQDCIDTRTASGRMILGILMVVSQAERELISERTASALQHKIRGRQRVGKVLFGYDLGSDGSSLTPNDCEQHTIRIIQELRSAGSTLRQIAAELTSRGIATKEGLSTWTHSTVAYILKHDRIAA